MKALIGLLILTAFLSGCTQQQAGSTATNQTTSVNLKACSQDSDCVKVNEGCCSCNNGGSEIAINKNFTQYWSAKLSRDCSSNNLCPQVYMCIQSTPKCVNNECTLQVPKNQGIVCNGLGASCESSCNGTVIKGADCPATQVCCK